VAPIATSLHWSLLMRTLGNLLWLIMGGLLSALAWWFFGLLAFVTIVGIPWGRACFVIGQFTLLPFGREAIARDTLTGRSDLGTSPLGWVGNVLWFVFAGLWLALGHVTAAVACFVTLIGIPFGIQHLKLALLALAPIGKTIVMKDVAAAARGEGAQAELARLRGR
jgi:uncharacterized membrane protein YccF (DUF307 family)